LSTQAITPLAGTNRIFAVGEVGVICALLVIAAAFYVIEPSFLSERNVRAILNIVSLVGIIAIGQTVLLVNGEFDLSVGSVAGIGAVVSAKLMTALGWPVPAALFAGVLLGALIGLVNGVSVTVLRIPAFIQTLGMLFIGQGIIQIVTGGYPVYPLPRAIADIGRAQWIGGLGWGFFFFAVAAALSDFVLRHTVIGRNMYVTGGNPQVAELVGISTRRYKISAFVLVGALSAVAGMFVMADLASATTGIGSGWELAVIAGVVVGGVSLFGGAGTIVGGLIGILLLQAVQSGLVIVGVSANWQQITVGIIMILAVGLDMLRRRLAAEGAQTTDLGRSKTEPKSRRLWGRWAIGAFAIAVISVLAFTIKPSRVEHAIASRSLLFVQPLRDHPVCKLMQAGFLNRCQELGYHCEVVGNASATTLDVAATIPLAEAALARRQFGAVGVFALDTAIYPFIERLSEEKLPVVTWHVLPEQGSVKGLVAATGQDIAQVGEEAAISMGERLSGRGVVAITQGSFNTEENAKAAAFRQTLAVRYPGISVLEPQLEGYEPTAAKSKAVSLLQGNSTVTAVFSTTGNGAQTWAGAARAAGRELVIIGMDYIRANLDLVKSGEVYGIVAQPLYEEGAKTADLLAALARAEKVPYRNPLPAKVITASDLEPYYALLRKAHQ
jgi:ribose/xylose/arabinose/galactoside ABC-type transport system permease subunit/ABC-type sugar transport system substrate-binding protein